MPEAQLVSLRLFIEIIVGSIAIIATVTEVYTGTLRSAWRSISSMPDDLDTKFEELNRNQQEMIDRQESLNGRLENVEVGLEALGYAINEDREVDLRELQDNLGVESRPDDYLREGGGESPRSDGGRYRTTEEGSGCGDCDS